MHDVRAIRENPQAYVAGWRRRGVEDASAIVERVLELDRALRAAQTAEQEATSKKNAASKEIGVLLAQAQRFVREEDDDQADFYFKLAEQKKREAGELGQAAIESAKSAVRKFAKQLDGLLAEHKNLAADDVPDGKDENSNKPVGKPWFSAREEAPKPVVSGPAKDHADVGEALGLLDFEAAAKMSGARFAVLKGGLARLERAIGQFMLDLQADKHGYQEVNPPLLVRDEAMFGTGQLPKFKEDLFAARSTDWKAVEAEMKVAAQPTADRLHEEFEKLSAEGMTADEFKASDRWREIVFEDAKKLWARVEAGDFNEERWLIPTAEVSLTNLVRETILSEDELAQPMRLTALTPCFRAEAGSAGRDTRGLIRQHQFSKVELVSITRPEDSEAEHERMTGCAEAVLKALELPFRRMLLCAGDMGFSARKTYDLEVWLPSQGTYREISSCSNCGDFQARRMDARFKRAGEKKTEFVHTLNGSGLAVGRTLVAIMENYQDQDGRIAVPAALQPYMGGATHVG